jgi:hypothetical protein
MAMLATLVQLRAGVHETSKFAKRTETRIEFKYYAVLADYLMVRNPQARVCTSQARVIHYLTRWRTSTWDLPDAGQAATLPYLFCRQRGADFLIIDGTPENETIRDVLLRMEQWGAFRLKELKVRGAKNLLVFEVSGAPSRLQPPIADGLKPSAAAAGTAR